MTRRFDLVLRHVRLPSGRMADVGITNGRFADIAPNLAPSDNDINGNGKFLIPGLHDHHIHLLATAARMQSVDLAGICDVEKIIRALRANVAKAGPGTWVRAVGYDERAAGIPDRYLLDAWLPDCPLRLQDRTGALWVFNSAALELIGDRPWPDAVEIDENSEATGRIWRGDDWVRERIGSNRPSLASLSTQLAGWGVTAVTDAGANNGPEEAAIFAGAISSGELRQRLTLMGREDLPDDTHYQTGPVKLLFDERNLPDVSDIVMRIKTARSLGRAVAAHCVTEAELVIYLAALEQAGGALIGDRIEHGSMIPQCLTNDILEAGLKVVSNPGFIALRGDRYLDQMNPIDLSNLHRLGSLDSAGIGISAGSDAPYGPVNPWITIRAAMFRKTTSGAVVCGEEALVKDKALRLFSGKGAIWEGEIADCCLLEGDWVQHLLEVADPNPVRFVLIGGALFGSS